LSSASVTPSIRVTRTVPPAPGSNPSVTSGSPNCASRRSTAIRWVAGEGEFETTTESGAVERGDPPAAQPFDPAEVRLDLLSDGERRTLNSSPRSPAPRRSTLDEVTAIPDDIAAGLDDIAAVRLFQVCPGEKSRPWRTSPPPAMVVPFSLSRSTVDVIAST
jgi:hypothetical protein